MSLILYRFRWVVCQLDTLRTCLKRPALLKALNQLPKTLDETYNQILLRIPEDYHHDARVVFNLLAFSSRPVSLGEAAEAVAIDLELKSFDSRNQLPDLAVSSKSVQASSHCRLCNLKARHLREKPTNDESRELRFAHYSIKEYLLSQRISLPAFQIHGDNAHGMNAKLCLIYLLSFR